VIQKTSWVTPDKQDGFTKYVTLHAHIVKAVLTRERPNGWKPYQRYVYIDTHAGDGTAGECLGSPLLFLAAIHHEGLPFDAHLIEREPGNVRALRSCLDNAGHGGTVRVYEGDNETVIHEVILQVPQYAFGMLYMDPFGPPSSAVLTAMSVARQRIDLMVRVPTTTQKRVRTAFDGRESLSDVIKKAAKQNWLIRAPLPSDKQQWVFLFGTNYSGLNDWKRERFYRIDSPEGRQMFETLNYTKEEQLDLMQPGLFQDAQVRERSGGVCERCRVNRSTERHHLWYGPGHDPKQLLDVCHECHCQLEGKAS